MFTEAKRKTKAAPKTQLLEKNEIFKWVKVDFFRIYLKGG